MRYRLVEMTMILVLAMAMTLSILQFVRPSGVSVFGVEFHAPGSQFWMATNRDKELNNIAQYQGMHEAAQANGGTYGNYTYLDRMWAHVRARSVPRLVDDCPLIIVGAIQGREPRLQRKSPMIDTIYPVLVSETIKGDARSVVKVRIPGGRVTFKDGTVAETWTPGFELRTSGTYVLFLRPAPIGVGTDPTDVTEGVQVLSVGLQGLIDISTGRTQAFARSDDPLRAQLHDRAAAELLNELRALAHRRR